VLENMRENLEVLTYSTLAPCRYLVYLHAAEYARLEGIVPILRDQTVRALGEELEKLNHRPVLHRCADRLLRREPATVQNAGVDWQVEILQDPGDDVDEPIAASPEAPIRNADHHASLRPGDILVVSELLVPANLEPGVGARTRRITTVHVGQRASSGHPAGSDQPESRQPGAPAGNVSSRVVPWAHIAYEDHSGSHAYDVVKDSVSIGRGGTAYPVDVRIVSSVDVSREHSRIRRDPAQGRFFLIDLSSLGTTVNGATVPRGYDEVNGTKRENGIETLLPDRARIGLADAVYLDFCVRLAP
jgi:hypothetical protein